MKRSKITGMVGVANFKRLRRGRPPVPAERKLSHPFVVLLDREYRAKIERLRALGIEPGQFGRDVICPAIDARLAAAG
jgi:hypothetical protein